MTTYPGDDPQTPDDRQDPATRPRGDDVPTPEAPDGTEPTQPVGYWEGRAREQAAEQARAQGGQPYPTTPYPHGGPVLNTTSQTPYGQAPQDQGPYAQDPNARNPYAQNPYPQPGSAAYGGQPAGPAPGYQPGGQPAPYAPTPPYGGYVVRPPDHSQATLALVLGLVGVVGAFIFCGVTLLVSPFALGVGHSALRDIRASQGRLGGESQARTGMILGIVGTALLILAVVVVLIVIVTVIASDPSSTTGSSV